MAGDDFCKSSFKRLIFGGISDMELECLVRKFGRNIIFEFIFLEGYKLEIHL